MDQLRTDEIEDIPRELLAEPLEWFFAEHFRHRLFCRLINEVAAAHVFDGERVTKVVEFLRNDLPVHIIDEEQDLFPLLRRRALPEDEVEKVLGLLSAEHKADASHARVVREQLEDCLARQSAPGMDPAIRKALQGFASQELRHLALENAVVLPIARLRLSQRDLEGLSRRLAARRGIVLERAAP
ncbi:hemerythrin domain-containing protein [Phenylobacterium sp.]|uniref:hemerythrin domain-containing protein n=1 Tax=Phenylobacterium sp. TaxID=1871053 RepID=UPI002ED993C8